MVFCDKTLKQLCKNGLVFPYEEVNVNPASIDIRVGKVILVEDIKHKEIKDFKTTKLLKCSQSYFRFVDLTTHYPGKPYFIKPGTFLLAETLEKVTMPNNYVGQVMLKSTMARLGWEHSEAGYIDPGFSGIITMEIKNTTNYHILPIWYGMKFGQLSISQLDYECEKPYNGRYQRAIGVEGAK